MVAHPRKPKIMKVGSRPALKNAEDITVLFNNLRLDEVDTFKYLGLNVDSTVP